MGLKTEATGNQYIDNRPKQTGVNSSDAQINSVFTVESQSEVTPAPAAPVQNQTMLHQSATEEVLGYYTIDALKKYLHIADEQNHGLILKLAEEQLNDQLNEYNQRINDFTLNKNQQEIFDRLFPSGEEGLKKAIIEAYFEVDRVFEVIREIEHENIDPLSMSNEELYEQYRKRSRSCGEDGQYSETTSELKNLFISMHGKTINEKKEIIKQYILNACLEYSSDKMGPPQYNTKKLLSAFKEIQNHISLNDTATKIALINAIALLDSDEQLGALSSILNEDCKDDNERIELITSLNFESLEKVDPDVLNYIIDFVTKKLHGNPDANIEQGIESIRKAAQNGGTMTSEARAALIEFLQMLTVASIGREDSEQIDGSKLGEAIEENCTEEEKRRIYEGVNDLWNQHPDWFQGVDQDKFNEIMNRISNGNYGIVVEDILRGDGVHSPLNMPSSNGNNSNGGSANTSVNNYGSGASSTSSTSSAQNAQTGFFNVQPQSVIYNTQNNLAQLKQQVQKASAQNNTPQLVTSATDIDSALASGEKLEEVVKTQIKENGVTGFVKDVLNSKVAIKCAYVKDKALTYFDSMSADIKRITFDGIHNTSNAILAARRLSLTELGKVHAQNIYVKENLEQIEEEKKKQERLS